MKLETIASQTVNFVKKNKNFFVWTSVASLASIADIYMTTNYAQTTQDEANPIMRYLWENHGVPGMISGKIATISILSFQSKKLESSLYLKIPSVIYSLGALSWYLK